MVRGERSRVVRLCAVLAIAAVALTACGGGSSKRAKGLVVTAKGGPVSVKVDQPLVLVVESNPSTGFTWTRVGKPSSKSVKFIKEAMTKTSSTVPGAPDKQKFRYRGISTGSATITLRYARPDQPDAPDNTTLTYQVTVTKK